MVNYIFRKQLKAHLSGLDWERLVRRCL